MKIHASNGSLSSATDLNDVARATDHCDMYAENSDEIVYMSLRYLSTNKAKICIKNSTANGIS